MSCTLFFFSFQLKESTCAVLLSHLPVCQDLVVSCLLDNLHLLLSCLPKPVRSCGPVGLLVTDITMSGSIIFSTENSCLLFGKVIVTIIYAHIYPVQIITMFFLSICTQCLGWCLPKGFSLIVKKSLTPVANLHSRLYCLPSLPRGFEGQKVWIHCQRSCSHDLCCTVTVPSTPEAN